MSDLGEMEFRAKQLGKEGLGRSSRENMERPKKRAEMDPESSKTHGQHCSPKVLLQSLKYSKPLIFLLLWKHRGTLLTSCTSLILTECKLLMGFIFQR